MENAEPAGVAVRQLSEAHREGNADVALLATSASETLRDGTFPGSYRNFKSRIEAVGFSHLTVLHSPAVWSLTFWGRSYWVDPESYHNTSKRLWSLMFPKLDPDLPASLRKNGEPDQCIHQPKHRKWRNAWCDVHNLITHIDYKRDVFVTSNISDFQRHAERLKELGAGLMRTPEMAVEELMLGSENTRL